MMEHGLSERPAHKRPKVGRTSYQYAPMPSPDGELREESNAPAKQNPCHGCRRFGLLLALREFSVNHKKLCRLYLEGHLACTA